MKPPGLNGWDNVLLEAAEYGEAIVVRGDISSGDYELDPVPLRLVTADPHADAAERAFPSLEDAS